MNKTILHIRSSGGFLGAENVIFELCKRAEEHGYKAIIGALQNVGQSFPEFLTVAAALKIETVVFPCKRQFDVKTCRLIKKYAHAHDVSLIHTHGFKEDFFGIMACTHLPKVATNHLWKRTNLKEKIYCFLDRFFLRFYDKVIGVSDEIVYEMQTKGIKNPIKIANGIDVEKFNISLPSRRHLEEFTVKPSNTVVGMISSLTPEKGHRYALSAFSNIVKKHIHAKLLIVGHGPLADELKNLAVKLKIQDKVIFSGMRLDIPSILSIVDIFLLASTAEGLPMALLEAMAAKKAVIATAVGDVPLVLENNRNGLIIASGNPQAIEDATCRLLGNDAERKQLGENALETVQKKYSSAIMAKNYYELYDDLL